MNIALKRLAGAGLAALTLAGSAVTVSGPALAQGSDYCKHHSCGPGGHHRDVVRRDSYRHEGYRHEGYRHDGPGVAPLVGGIVSGILGGAAAAASGEDCWRQDEYGREYSVC